MTIKKHPNKNRYLLTEHGLWVRDFTRTARAADINGLTRESEYRTLAANEATVRAMNVAAIDVEPVRAPDVVIVSDGHGFEERKKLLKSLPRKVVVLGTNRSLAKHPDVRMDWFVANNPYREAMACLPPSGLLPKCVASVRTFPEFVWRWRQRRGSVYRYTPAREARFGGLGDAVYHVDDYRNPICAAVGLAYRFGVRRLMLFCCDDAFEGERPGTVRLPNGLFQYPQQELAHGLINGNLFWLRSQNYAPVEVGDFSSGPGYDGVRSLTEGDISAFFA
jgi:hypothetical protein